MLFLNEYLFFWAHSMKGSKRPVFLDLRVLHFPITAIVSIFHRISGLVLALSLPLVVFFVQYSLSSESAFVFILHRYAVCNFMRGFVLIFSLAYIYHALAGIRHLIMDIGYGLEKKCAVISAYALLSSFLIIALFIMWGVLWG